MTRGEAIARIRNHKIVHKMNEPRAIYISEALDMAIKALEQEPCSDAISRQAALSDEGLAEFHFYEDYIKMREYLMSLPSVIPSRPTEPCEDVKPISYQNCADAMMKMWIENVVTDGEYNRIMDKLNTWHMGRKDIGVVNERTN